MYGFQETNLLSSDQVLQKVTQEQIFELVLKESFNFEKRYQSPFRDDKRPGCRFERRPDGTILFIDFVEKLLGRPEKVHRTCFNMVMEDQNVTMRGAIHIVCQHFGLSLDVKQYEDSKKQVFSFDANETTHRKFLGYTPKDYDRQGKIFWSQFIIKPEHLIEDNVFQTDTFRIEKDSGKIATVRVYGLCFAIDFLHAVKLYQPNSVDYKFITNCDEDDIGNINNISDIGDELVIQKSYKDHRVLRNLGVKDVIWFHNEGCLPSRYILENLLSRFRLITIFFDNDLAGRKAAKSLMIELNILKPNSTRMVYLPRRRIDMQLRGSYLKDVGEFVKAEGREDTHKVLKQIGL